MNSHLALKESKEKDQDKENQRISDNVDKGPDVKEEEEKEKKKAREEGEKGKEGVKASKASKDGDTDKCKKRKPLNSRLYCRLGHLHLLLEQYPQGGFLPCKNRLVGLVVRRPH